MKYDIDPFIIDETTKCKRGLACITGKGKPCCTISKLISDTVFLIEDDDETACPYRSSFGFSQLCNCPVRQELHRKYNI